MEPKAQDWHRADIKSALERGITLRDLFVRPVYHLIHCAMSFTRSSPRAERIIADALGISRRRRSGRVALWRYANKNDANTAE
ncbi:helix-turn-helix domain-containing protein [Salmonella enterica subsp. enterica]|nr:helix-turn-helix domain-containing protein [Salmonella enterica subsp. enterica]